MVIYLGLNLGELSGLDLWDQIKKQNPIAIIYAITANADLFNLLECGKVGFDDFYTKPVSIELLSESTIEGFEKIKRWKVRDFDFA